MHVVREINQRSFRPYIFYKDNIFQHLWKIVRYSVEMIKEPKINLIKGEKGLLLLCYS